MRRATLALLALAVLATPLDAQSLRERFGSLFVFGDCGEPMCLDVAASVHGNHYNPAVTQGENNLLALVVDAISLNMANLPFTAASSGVVFTFEEGVPVAVPISPGPIFSERAETLGGRRFLVGANVSGFHFDHLRGVPLRNMRFLFAHENTGGALGDPTFENDVIEVKTNLNLNVIATTFYAAFGVTHWLDVGVLVPLVRATLDGRSEAVINVFQFPSPHAFGTDQDPSLTASASSHGSALGVGDIGARLKVNVYDQQDWGLALVGDVRLPTGDEANFLGSGATVVRALAVFSARYGVFSPAVNAGFLITTDENQNDRFLANVAFDQLVSDRVSFAVELVSSFELGASKLVLPEPVVFTAPVVRRLELHDIPDRADHLVDASFGMKFGLGEDQRIVTNARFPLTRGGMRPQVMWMLGLERAF